MRLTVLSSGPLSPAALHALVGQSASTDTPSGDVICITNSASDVSLAGLRFAPDLDAAVNALTSASADSAPLHERNATDPTSRDDRAPGARPDRRSGAAGTHVLDTLRRNAIVPDGEWALDDDNVAHAIARVYRMSLGAGALECAAAQSRDTDATVLPLTQDPVELHVIETRHDGERSSRHAARWIADPARLRPEAFAVVGMESATVTPGVLDAIRAADCVVLPPMSPVLDAAAFLAAPGLRDALRGTSARVVVMSPAVLDDGRPAGVGDAAWKLTGQPPAASSLARLYADFADVLLVDEAEPSDRYPSALTVARVPLQAALAGDAAAARTLRAALRA